MRQSYLYFLVFLLFPVLGHANDFTGTIEGQSLIVPFIPDTSQTRTMVRLSNHGDLPVSINAEVMGDGFFISLPDVGFIEPDQTILLKAVNLSDLVPGYDGQTLAARLIFDSGNSDTILARGVLLTPDWRLRMPLYWEEFEPGGQPVMLQTPEIDTLLAPSSSVVINNWWGEEVGVFVEIRADGGRFVRSMELAAIPPFSSMSYFFEEFVDISEIQGRNFVAEFTVHGPAGAAYAVLTQESGHGARLLPVSMEYGDGEPPEEEQGLVLGQAEGKEFSDNDFEEGRYLYETLLTPQESGSYMINLVAFDLDHPFLVLSSLDGQYGDMDMEDDPVHMCVSAVLEEGVSYIFEVGADNPGYFEMVWQEGECSNDYGTGSGVF